jgi:hypothetical protein
MSAEQRAPHLNGRLADSIPDRAGLFVRLYRRVTQTLVERWFGGVHAGLVVKSLYLQRSVAKFLRTGNKAILDAGCGPEGQLATLLAARFRPVPSKAGICTVRALRSLPRHTVSRRIFFLGKSTWRV